MQSKAICKRLPVQQPFFDKIFLSMRMTAFLLIIGILQASAHSYAQSAISISEKNTPLEKVFEAIQKQTDYNIWFDKSSLVKTKSVTIDLRDATLEKVLDACCKDQPIEWSIVGKNVIIKEKKEKIIDTPPGKIDVKGRVVDEQGAPVAGASITVKGSRTVALTGADGTFSITAIDENATIVFSGASVEMHEEKIEKRNEMTVVLKKRINKLDEVQIIGYGSTTRRLNTGDVTTITSDEISKQPVSNVVEALQGRVPGLYIQSSSGRPAASISVQLRGINSIAAGTTPLFIVDGVPFGTSSLDQLAANGGGLNPLNSINPTDIESVDVLKDADATAIYGSRASNGVILITTKKGKPGKAKFDISFYTGIGKTSRFADMATGHDYLQLRRQGFANDGVVPTAATAPDLLVWDTTQSTNWQKEIMGHAAPITNVEMNLSGGNQQTRFFLGGGYHRQGTVSMGPDKDERISGHINLSHNSQNNKFGLEIFVNYSTNNNLLTPDITFTTNLPPNYPVYDSLGKLNWVAGITNPYSYFLNTYSNQTNTLITNGAARYTIWKGLQLKLSTGYTRSDLDQIRKLPIEAQDPANSPLGSSYFADNHATTWIIEPQLNYSSKIGFGNFNFILGSTLQQSLTKGKIIYAYGFADDALLDNIASAKSTIPSNSYTEYKYSSMYARANYNIQNKIIINLNYRRDGSSRFGPEKKLGDFGSVAAAWIFSEENFFNRSNTISFGKIKASYGITGSDLINDYQYLPTYSSTFNSYLIPGLYPTRIGNPDYGWETNKKFEVSLDLGFFRDRILFNADFYLNSSANQLVNYPLPAQAGFTSYQANLPAVVRNNGVEMSMQTVNIKGKDFQWKTTFNINFASNKLVSFPGLANTSYGTVNLVVGQPLSLMWGIKYLGIDPKTGSAIFADPDQTGSVSYPGDYDHFGTTLPAYFGGIGNSLQYKSFQLDFFFRFTKQKNQSFRSIYYAVPGMMNNVDAQVKNDIWTKQGDQSLLPKATSGNTADDYTYYVSSDRGGFEDASYIKLSNLSVSYSINEKALKKMKLNTLRFFVMGQNLLTITKYGGFDPETLGAGLNQPTLRIITFGLNCSF